MDLFSAIYDVKNLNGYIAVTEEYANRSQSNLKVPLNTATVLALKKVRSFEIEYFNKRDENGIACTLLQNLLCIPPSKVWGLLAKELIHLLQYWLEAIRKHLINHTTRWWMFLSLLLKSIKDIYLKDTTIPDLLVEFTAECLFDLATAAKPDVYQRHEILHCLNMVCAASSREVRFAFRTKFADCFVKLASGMSTSGFFPYQYSALECLLRWLLLRQERSLRALALDKWFPRDLCPDAARALFLNSTWMNFLKDARDFLNALNDGNGLLTSVICRHLTIGQTVVINGTERQVTWIDFNTSVKCVSVLLDPRELEVFGITGHRACEALLIDGEITETAVLRRESQGLTISLDLHRPPSVRPNAANVNGQKVTALVSSRTDLRALDRAMRTTFGDKYQLLLDLDIEVSQSPQVSSCKIKPGNCSEDDSRFSHPVQVKRHKRAGYCVRSKYGEGIASPAPSSASTCSIIHLKEKLAALPRFARFDKDPVHVLAEPSLSKVSETPELDNCERITNAFPKPPLAAKCRSDGETPRPRNRGGIRELYPVVSDDNEVSMFPVGSYDTDIIETEKLPKDYAGENIIDALSREALLAIPPKDNTDEKKSQEESEAIDDTPNEIREARNRVPYKQPRNISTTDDESNTEAINETPTSVSRKKSAVRSRNKPAPHIEEKQTFDVKTVEDFFSQHVAENQRGEIIISPRLAKKINETSSETSDNYLDDNDLLNEEIHTDIEQRIFDDAAIIDCLNDMIDIVCRDFDNYTDNLFHENITEIMACIDQQDDVDLSNVKDVAKPKPIPKAKNIKLKFKSVKKAKPRATKKSKAVLQKDTKKMSTIIEQKDEEIHRESENEHVEVVKILSPKKVETPKSKNMETPSIRKKRKLYSPKDDAIEEDIVQYDKEKTSDDVPLSKIKKIDSSKATAMCYKEIENERKKYIRRPRTRKSKGKITPPPSPRTAKMNTVFDNLKVTNKSNETIRLVSKGDNVYNFSSDSEDEDFKKKKIEIKKRLSVEPKAKAKKTRRGKGSDTSHEDTNKTKPVKRKTVTKRNTKQKALEKVAVVDLVKIDLVDEKMREAVREKLNTSIVVEPPTNLEPVELEPTLAQAPQMEHIHETESNDTVVSKKRTTKKERQYNIESNDMSTNKKIKETQLETQDSASNDTLTSKKNENKKTKKNKAVAAKKEKGAQKVKTIEVPENDDGTSSPLPGLLVEKSKPKCKDDINDSLNTNMLQKFKKIYRDGPEANDSVLTQNMLSDVEIFNSSAQNKLLDEIPFADYDKRVVGKAKKQNENTLPPKPNKKVAKKKIETTIDEVIEIEDEEIEDGEIFNSSAQNKRLDEIRFTDYHKGGAEKAKKQSKNALPPKTNKKVAKKKIETTINEVIEIDIVSEHDRQSDISIPTDGITAHGDENEAPPAEIDSIVETFEPRELEDLSEAMKDYFTELTREIHDSSKASVESNKSAKETSVDNTSCRSPIVSVKRLSPDDLSKWMPSRRTSDTDSPRASSKISAKKISETPSSAESSVENTPRVKTKTAETPKLVKTRKDTSKLVKNVSPKSPIGHLMKLKSPNVALAKISLDEFNKWLPPMPLPDEKSSPKKPRRELKLIYPTRSKSKVINEVIRNVTQKDKSIAKTAEVHEPVETIIQTDTNTTHSEKKISSLRSRSALREALRKRQQNDTEQAQAKEQKNKQKIKRNTKPSPAETAVRKSMISPIKLSGNLTPIIEIGNSSDDESDTDLRTGSQLHKSRSNLSKTDSIVSRETSKSQETPEIRKRTSKSPIVSVPKKISFAETSFDVIRASKKPEKCIIEPKRLFVDTIKKINVLEDVTLERSGPSSSGVNDWFKRTEPDVIDPALSLKDTIQNVIERLDTTLVEVNHSTTKKFVNLFVEAQSELDVISGDLSNSLAVIERFKQKFKKKSLDLMRVECYQRRAMVALLKDDFQAAVNNIDEDV